LQKLQRIFIIDSESTFVFLILHISTIESLLSVSDLDLILDISTIESLLSVSDLDLILHISTIESLST